MSWRSGNTAFAENQDREAIAQENLDNYWRTVGVTVDRTQGCKLFDAIYTTKKSVQKAEEKFRAISDVRGDFLLEIMQALEDGNMGWFVKTGADLLVYVLCDDCWRPLIIYHIRWAAFRDWYLGQYLVRNKLGNYVVSTKGYGVTINLAIKISDIPDDLYKMVDLRG